VDATIKPRGYLKAIFKLSLSKKTIFYLGYIGKKTSKTHHLFQKCKKNFSKKFKFI